MYFGLYWYLFCKYWHILISTTCLPENPDTHSGMYQFVLVCIGKDVFRFFVTFQFSAMLHCKPHLVHGVLFLQLQLSPDLIIWTYQYVPMYILRLICTGFAHSDSVHIWKKPFLVLNLKIILSQWLWWLASILPAWIQFLHGSAGLT